MVSSGLRGSPFLEAVSIGGGMALGALRELTIGTIKSGAQIIDARDFLDLGAKLTDFGMHIGTDITLITGVSRVGQSIRERTRR